MRCRAASPSSTIRTRDARRSASCASTSAWSRSFSTARRAAAADLPLQARAIDGRRVVDDDRDRPALSQDRRQRAALPGHGRARERVPTRRRIAASAEASRRHRARDPRGRGPASREACPGGGASPSSIASRATAARVRRVRTTSQVRPSASRPAPSERARKIDENVVPCRTLDARSQQRDGIRGLRGADEHGGQLAAATARAAPFRSRRAIASTRRRRAAARCRAPRSASPFRAPVPHAWSACTRNAFSRQFRQQ